MQRAKTASLLIFGALVAIFGVLALVGLAQANEACTGEIVDTVLCEAAKMRQSIFGGLVATAVLIGAAILAGAWVIAEQITGSRELHRIDDA